MSAPFATASASFTDLAEKFNALQGTVPQLSGSGQSVDAINEKLMGYDRFVSVIAEAMMSTATVCGVQADADAVLLAPVSYADFKRQRDEYVAALRSGDQDRIDQERTLFEEYTQTRDAKVTAHAGTCAETDAGLNAVKIEAMEAGAETTPLSRKRAAGGFNDDDPANQTPKGDEQGTPSESTPSDTSATPRTSDTSDPARTRVSSDGGTVAGVNPSLSPTTANPAMMSGQPQTPQGGTSPQGGMNPVTAQHLNGNNKSPKPNLSGMSSNSAVKEAERRRREERNRDRDKMSEGEMNALIGGVPVPIDRGVSVQGVSTDKDTSGRAGTTNLSAGGQQPNSNNANPNNQNPRMGGGMMGGAGAMGAGNNASNIKPRDNATPAAFADRDLLGFQSVRDGVDGGRVENSTSENPDFDKWSGSVSLLDNPDKDKK